jgi:hypothetical protein
MNLETWARVRRKVLVESRSKRSVMAEEGLHWETLQKMLAHASPPGYLILRDEILTLWDGHTMLDAAPECPILQQVHPR